MVGSVYDRVESRYSIIMHSFDILTEFELLTTDDLERIIKEHFHEFHRHNNYIQLHPLLASARTGEMALRH